MRGVLAAVRRPEHTGERRCWPCTAVNLAVLAVGCGGVVANGWLVPAVVLAAVGVGAVWLRGYLVPYTPQFAPRLVAPLPGDPFGVRATRALDGGSPAVAGEGDPDGGGTLAGEDGPPDPEAVLEVLAAADVVDVTEEAVSLDESVFADWEAEMAALRSLDDDDLAAAVAETSTAARVDAVRPTERTWIVLADADRSPSSQVWLSPPVAVAETAAARALAGRLDDHGERLAAAAALRGFLDTCPVCERDLVETSTASCCGGQTTTPERVLACESCDARLYTLPALE